MLGKHTLSPNETTELKVSYDTAGRPGPFEKKVILTVNIPGRETIEIFTIKGNVREAPGAKISIAPRRIALEGAERSAGKKQILSVTNEGSLPLAVARIISKDGKTIYFDEARQGSLIVEPAQTKMIEIQLNGSKEEKPEREYIIVESNAKNAGDSGYFLIVQYGAP